MSTRKIDSVAEAALEIKKAGWEPVRLPSRSKNPARNGWQNERLSEAEIPGAFSDDSNLGILTGEPSGGLVDVDLDSPEAIDSADLFLPTTGMVHGRPSKPNSHRWYVTNPVPRTIQWKDPDGTSLVELRGTGGQTIAPPSIHPDGEQLAWTSKELPAEVELDLLQHACVMTATTSSLARHWPEKGSRHEAALSTGGFLLGVGLNKEEAVRIVETAARLAGDEEWQTRGNDVRDTARKLDFGIPLTGGPTMAEVLTDGERVLKKFTGWLAPYRANVAPRAWDPPLPFSESSGPQFPIEVFTRLVKEYVESLSLSLQVPVDLVGSLVLGVGAAAGARRCHVRINREWIEPLNLYIVCALPSGERKSPAFREVTAPIEGKERELAVLAAKDIAASQTEYDILSQRLNSVKHEAAKERNQVKRNSLTQQALELADELSGLDVSEPPRMIADDVTPEAVVRLLSEQNGRLAIMSPEGGLFETAAGRYANGVPNIDVFLKAYSGDSLRVDRRSKSPLFVAEPALTLCLTVQPEVIHDLASKHGFRGRGLLARFLYCVPASLVGFRSSETKYVPDQLRLGWNRTIKNVLKLPFPAEDTEHAIRLSEDALPVFQQFRDKVELQLRPGAELSEIADWGNKLCGSVARLAGILHLFSHHEDAKPWETPVSENTVRAAIRLGEYFADHARIAFSMMGSDPRVDKARGVWSSIQHLGLEQFSRRDLWQHVRRRFKAVDELSEVLSILVDMGYLRPDGSESHTGPGRPASSAFEVNPLARTQNTQYPQYSDSRGNSVDSVDIVYTSGGIQIDAEDDEGVV